MTKEKILVVEDEEDILALVTYNLTREGYMVTGVTSGEAGLESVSEVMPQLIVLDLMLPGVDGLTVCRTLKENLTTKDIPIVMMTAKGEETDIITGLELGADDYITKPFSPKVMIARIRAVLRRHATNLITADDSVTRDEITINPGRHEVLINNIQIRLTSNEFRLLHYLAMRPGWVFTRDQIIAAVHTDDFAVTDRSVDVLIVGLRRKMGEAGCYIETVRGVGYRFIE